MTRLGVFSLSVRALAPVAAGPAAPPAKSAWRNARDGAVGAGRSVKRFFTSLFSK